MSLRLFLVDDEAPARVRLRTLLGDIAAQCPHQVVGEADSGITALPLIVQTRPDLVFLDVQMPGMNGIELAGHLLRQVPGIAIVFITAFDEYAVQAFDVQALDYLLKPVRATRLAAALQRVAALRPTPVVPTAGGDAGAGPGANVAGAVAGDIDPATARKVAQVAQVAGVLHIARQHFSVQERGRVLLVPVTDVLYLRAEQKYVTLKSREREYLIEDSLVSIEEELASQLVRVHRNALVARSAIAGVERAGSEAGDSWQVIVHGVPERLPISRRQWPVIKALVK
jgi:two-component system response regulator AlgR